MWIRERHFVKKLLVFFAKYHTGTVSEEKRIAFLEKMKKDERYREKVVDHIVVLVDRFVEYRKSEILANLLLAHLNGKYDWEGFQNLSICLDGLHLQGIPLIEKMAISKTPYYEGFREATEEEAFLASSGIAVRWGTHYQISMHGVYLHIYGIKGDIDFDINSLQSTTIIHPLE